MSGRQSAAVDEALRLIAGGMNPFAAAKAAGIWPATIYRALKRQREANAATNPRPVAAPAPPETPDASPAGSVPPDPVRR